MYVPSKSTPKLERASTYFGEAIDLYHETIGQKSIEDTDTIQKSFKIDISRLNDQVRVSD